MNYIGTRIVFIRPPAPESPLFILAPTNDEAAKRHNEQLNARQRIRIGGIALSRLFHLFSAACAIAKGSMYRQRAWSLASNMSWEIRLWRIDLYLFGHQSFLFGCLLLLVAVALSPVAQVFFAFIHCWEQWAMSICSCSPIRSFLFRNLIYSKTSENFIVFTCA